MTLGKELYDIEHGFWLAGKEHFLDHVDDKCLLAFPQAGEMHGVHSRAEVAATATNPNRWRDLTMKDRQPLQSGDDLDRKGVGWGKSVSVRVDLGGRPIMKKKHRNTPSMSRHK